MKKTILSILYIIGIGLPLFTACETNIDDNPVLYEAQSFVLETPKEKVYDLGEAQDTVTLECTQPDYGFTAATTYSVQVSLDETFTEGDNSNYIILSTTYNITTIQLKPTELNAALVKLYKAAYPEEETTGKIIPAYIRLTAMITGSEKGASTSNIVKINQIKLGEILSTLEPPTEMYLVGSSIGEAWNTWKPMVSVNGMAGEFWSMEYLEAGAEFKFGKFEQDWTGYDKVASFKNETTAQISDKGGNIQIDQAGWYIIYIIAEVDGDNYKYTMAFYKPEVYVFGNTCGEWDYKEEWKFTVPEDKNGNFISPALKATGEARMCIKVQTDWWRLEFTLKDGKNIFYRENNTVNAGWTDLGAEYSVTGNSGQKIYLNFTKGTGEVK